MADYNKYYPKLRVFEGGWVHNPNDSGGETFMGITRRYHPNWDGWKRVDDFKKRSGFPRNANNDSQLREKVRQFYKKEYWDAVWADKIKSQKLAEQIVDTGINMGQVWAIRFAYRVVKMPERNKMTTALIDKLNNFETI